jgi:lipopolysaccharide transport system ATP-binding protein
MKPAIEVENLSKKFRIDHAAEPYLSLRDSFKKILKRRSKEDFYALKDINFSVNEGDSIGIIGRNGAGKSTLLKIISRITPPTTGSITYRGRVASLLEVGTGFHSELTGRENIFMNGSILGMRKAEIKKNFDAIIDFAGVEKFMDTPLKHYSSGMQLRLAFAVAAFMENEILIIDEVLAVGDTEFQKKCIGKMDEVSKTGRTLLFVSHDLEVISRLTRKAILLKQGSIAANGETEQVINEYLKTAIDHHTIFEKAPGKEHPEFTKIEVITSHAGGIHKQGEELKINFEINMPEVIADMAVSFQIMNLKNQSVLFSWVFSKDQPFCLKTGVQQITCSIPQCRLYKGDYYLKVHLAETRHRKYFELVDNICQFRIEMLDKEEIEWGWQENICTYLEDFTWMT